MTLYRRGSATAAQGPVRDCNPKMFCNLRNHKFKDQFSRIDTWDNEASSWINNQTGAARATLWSGKHGKSSFFMAPVGQDKALPGQWNDNVNEVKPC